ncbi:uncharacterized protein LOC141665230 [Apium graveolens]|uniref:uncharacterized protein LOC141665230 n=1 Tax=Apium graveolens TaxID=4045 RepID=UPI003D7A9FC5
MGEDAEWKKSKLVLPGIIPTIQAESLSLITIFVGIFREKGEAPGWPDSDCGLRDLGNKGNWRTWERGKTPASRIKERLDRFLATTDWITNHPHATVEHLIRIKSDHAQIIVRREQMHQQRRRYKGKKGFKFESSWLLDESCEAVVKSTWERSEGFRLTNKLKAVAGELIFWSRDTRDDLGKKVEDVEKILKEL